MRDIGPDCKSGDLDALLQQGFAAVSNGVLPLHLGFYLPGSNYLDFGRLLHQTRLRDIGPDCKSGDLDALLQQGFAAVSNGVLPLHLGFYLPGSNYLDFGRLLHQTRLRDIGPDCKSGDLDVLLQRGLDAVSNVAQLLHLGFYLPKSNYFYLIKTILRVSLKSPA